MLKLSNEHLIGLGVKIFSLDFDIGHERCRVTLQVVD